MPDLMIEAMHLRIRQRHRLAERTSTVALLLGLLVCVPLATATPSMATEVVSSTELDEGAVDEASEGALDEIDEASTGEAAADDPEQRKVAAQEFPGIDLEEYARVLQLYRDGNIAAGDAAVDQFEDPAALKLLEWAGLRGGSVKDFDRIADFMRENPDWPGRYLLRTRAEQALLDSRPSDEALLAFFASEKPRTTQGTVALAEALRREGATEDAQALIRDIWRNTSLGDTSELRLMLTFPGTLTRADHRIRMERRLFAQDWTTARRAAALAGEDFETLVELRQAVMKNPSNVA